MVREQFFQELVLGICRQNKNKKPLTDALQKVQKLGINVKSKTVKLLEENVGKMN